MELTRPNTVYKYHKINQHLFDLLSNGCLWFSHQNDLNDPYDCKYALSDDLLISLLKKSSSTLFNDLKSKIPDNSEINQDTFFEIILPKLRSNEWMNNLYNMLFGERLGWSVCCFTTNPLNELMWAHYADNSRGVCLEFDLSKTPELYEKLFPIKYNDTFPEIKSIAELPEALLRKRTAWVNEEEWRILTNVKGSKVFNKESLTAIYFGYNVDNTTIDNIRITMIKNGYKKVDFKQLNFRIKGVPLKPINKIGVTDIENKNASH